MQDRIPATGREGWVKLTQADGTVIEGKLEMNDNATVLGTPLNKETLLADEVAELFGLPPASATVSQALKTSFEMALGDRTLISVTVMTEDGFAIPGVAIQLSGEYYFTDENGMVNFDLEADGSTSYTFDLLLPWDLQSLSQTQIVTGPIQQGTVNRYTVTGVLKDLEDTVEIEFAQSASNVYFSGLFNVQKIWGCGGGASGGGAGGHSRDVGTWETNACATGGAGGRTGLAEYNGTAPKMVLDITIGAGGSPSTNGVGNSGGATTVFNKVSSTNVISASGGAGGNGMAPTSGNGLSGASGGSGSGSACIVNSGSRAYVGNSGVDGGSGGDTEDTTTNPHGEYAGGSGQGTTTRKFGESDNTLYCNAGGSAAYGSYGALVGSSGSGAGAGVSMAVSTNQAINGNPATVYGAGGGAVVYYRTAASTISITTGAGMQGVVFIRIAKVVTVA